MAAQRAPREVVAYAPCPFCKARCAHKRDVTGRVYAYCHGDEDAAGKACGSNWRMGRTHSENFIRQATAKAAPAPAPAPAKEENHGDTGSDDKRPDDGTKPAPRRGFLR